MARANGEVVLLKITKLEKFERNRPFIRSCQRVGYEHQDPSLSLSERLEHLKSERLTSDRLRKRGKSFCPFFEIHRVFFEYHFIDGWALMDQTQDLKKSLFKNNVFKKNALV